MRFSLYCLGFISVLMIALHTKPGLALPCFQPLDLTWARDQIENQHLVVISMSCKIEPVIRSRYTGQRIPWLDRCQLMITWMCIVRGKPRLRSLPAYYLEFGRHVARLRRRRLPRRRRHVHAPTRNIVSHDNHKKIRSWVSFLFLYGFGAPLGGPNTINTFLDLIV